MMDFFRDFFAESKRVVWPNRQDLAKMTLNVVILATIIALMIWGADHVLGFGLDQLLGLVK